MLWHLSSLFCVLFLLLLHAQPVLCGETVPTSLDLADIFATYKATGTMKVVDERPGRTRVWIHNPIRAEQRFAPASTYKIPHTLFALQAGVVRDEFQLFAWDGVERSFPGWNRDHTLRSAMRYSVAWVYLDIARRIGGQQAKIFLQAISYGNADSGTGQDPYWLDGPLAISASEQIDFLHRLYGNKLPFALAHQRLVKDILLIEADRDWRLRAKTGWNGKTGWWVGWVENEDGPTFFALNIDTPDQMNDLPYREAIGRRVLCRLQALPTSACLDAGVLVSSCCAGRLDSFELLEDAQMPMHKN
ncbi:MAG: class D beta-lactamase [Magnetococcus sp. DMHC-8]